MQKIVIAAFAMGLMITAATAAETIEARGKVEAVTLFRGQALVTRSVPVQAKAGAVQLTVTDLPDAVVGDSLFVNAAKDLQVRAVRYVTRAVGKAPEKEVQELDETIAALQRKLRANEAMKRLIGIKQTYLDRMDLFVAPTAKTEMTKGVLNADTLATVTDMVFEKRSTLAGELLDLDEEARGLQKDLELANRKRSEFASSHSRTMREAIVFLDKQGNADSQLSISYQVRNATWSPTYNVRGSTGKDVVAVEIGALAQQTSGEDWDAVTLTLSTAGARMVADGPALAPLRLNLGSAQTANNQGFSSLESQFIGVKSKLRMGQVRQQSTLNMPAQRDIQWSLNQTIEEMQHIELANDPADLKMLAKKLGGRESGLAVTYRIEGKVSISSRRDNQMVQIAKRDMPSTFFYEAIPLLTEQVHRYAELTNNSDLSLLQGTTSVYLDNEYVGKATLPMVARGQKVTIGFGTNPQLRAWREFVSKDEKGQLLSSKQEVKYAYRLVLDNYSDAPVTVRLLDRIPMQTEDVTVSLSDRGAPLSTDAHYQRVFRPKGILRWELEVPAKASQESAKILDYGFSLVFDAKLKITPSPVNAPDAQRKGRGDFEQIFDMRNSAY